MLNKHGLKYDTKCTECGHIFKDGEHALATSALVKIIDGKPVIVDDEPGIICFPIDSDGHYKD